MHREVLLADIAGDGHGVKDFHEKVVNLRVKALQDFIAESERLCHVAGLVVAAQKHHILWEVKLDGEQKDADFNAEDATINVVTKEEIVETTRLTGFADHVEQVSVLTMDVTNDTDGLLDVHEVGLSRKELQSGHQEAHDLRLGDGAFSREEILQKTPVGQVVLIPELTVFERLVDDLGAFSVVEFSVRQGIRQ